MCLGIEGLPCGAAPPNRAAMADHRLCIDFASALPRLTFRRRWATGAGRGAGTPAKGSVRDRACLRARAGAQCTFV
jgi:hypothetical protein